ncbi:hypothetical protein [Nocardia fluminea]|uniref:hypothetical protein n=1 Tax=Nocardia fluminea TaxID=134984 RepID=UPI00365F6D63
MTFLDGLTRYTVWANPFLPSPPFTPEPVPLVRPWVSRGRVSLAPELSWWDRLTWGAAVFAALNPDRPVYGLTVRDRVWCYLAAETAAHWTLPDDPFVGSTEWIRRERFRSIPPIEDPALRLPRRV